jgi:hypothetical protein
VINLTSGQIERPFLMIAGRMLNSRSVLVADAYIVQSDLYLSSRTREELTEEVVSDRKPASMCTGQAESPGTYQIASGERQPSIVARSPAAAAS